jgi:hypothetical protein
MRRKVDKYELSMNRVTLLSKAAYFTNSGQDAPPALPGMGEEWPFLMGRLGPLADKSYPLAGESF